jgi:hypothetical protein
MRARERLKAYAAKYAASYCGDDAWDKNDHRFQFLADGFCVTVFPAHDGGEHWAWSITREESGVENGRSKRRFVRPPEAMFEAWSAFAELVRAADTGEPPKLTREREIKAIGLLTDAFETLALAGAKGRVSPNRGVAKETMKVNKFPAECPIGRRAALNAGIELLDRKVREDPDIRRKYFLDHPLPPREFPPLTLKGAVCLMVKVLWSDDQFRCWLEDEDFMAAAEYLRREHLAPDEIMIAARADVADVVRHAVKRLLRGRRAR